MPNKENRSSLRDHIKTTSRKVDAWSGWKKKVVEQRILSNNRPFAKN